MANIQKREQFQARFVDALRRSLNEQTGQPAIQQEETSATRSANPSVDPLGQPTSPLRTSFTDFNPMANIRGFHGAFRKGLNKQRQPEQQGFEDKDIDRVGTAMEDSRPMTKKVTDATLDLVARFEGGFVDDPFDSGGATNFGVTLGFLQSVKPGATVDDLRAITPQDARKLFEDEFIVKPKIDQLPEPLVPLAGALSVNAGAAQAVKIVQELAGVKKDGVIGPATLEAARNVQPEQLKERIDTFYRRIVDKNPSQARFIKGWLNRNEGAFQLANRIRGNNDAR